MAGELFINRSPQDTVSHQPVNIDEAETISSDIEQILALLAAGKSRAAINALMGCCARWRWSQMWSHFVYCARTSTIFDFLCLDPISAYAITNPRESVYATPILDQLLDYSYPQLASTQAARDLSEAVWQSGIGQAVRHRRSYFSAFLTMAMDASVLVVDAGRMKELELLAEVPSHLVVGDRSLNNIKHLQQRYPTLQVRHLYGGSILSGDSSAVQASSLVYTQLSLDALSDEEVLRQMRMLWELTSEAGALVLASSSPYSVASSYFDLLFDEPLRHRGERELHALWRLALPDLANKLEIFRDNDGSTIFLRATKAITAERPIFELVSRENTTRSELEPPDNPQTYDPESDPPHAQKRTILS